ncbi:DUF1622 domain-containing protein [Candidatus Peregrinibacteria bacterium]|nr:DUF1622 domain-containing protein [Candidatus Peregrinibacteria bacterium]
MEHSIFESLLKTFIEYLGLGFDAVGVLAVAWGGIAALLFLLAGFFSKKVTKGQDYYLYKSRKVFVTKIILALEFFLAVDVIKTVVKPSWTTLGQLGALVVIRAALTYFLNKELQEVEEKV